MNTTPMKLYAKLLKVQKSVEKIPKTGTNTHQKYKYLEASVLIEYMRSYMLDENVLFFANVVDEMKEDKFVKVKMEFTLVDADSGEQMTSTFYGEGMDGSDKGYYKAYTGALKYFLVQTFMIPTGDDAEASNPENDNKGRQGYNNNNNNRQPYNKPNNKSVIPYKTQAEQKEIDDQFYKKITDQWLEEAGSMEGFDGWYRNNREVHKTNKNIYYDFMRKIEARKKKVKGLS